MKKNNVSLCISILWAVTAVLGVVTLIKREVQGLRFALRCVTVLTSAAAAVVNFDSYMRSISDSRYEVEEELK